MSLTADEVSLVQSTWAEVYKDPGTNGSIILKTFLDKYDYYGKFEKFKGVPREEITNNATYKNHVLKLMAVLNQALQNLTNAEELKKLLNGLGKAHKKRKIERIQFEQLRDIILDILTSHFKVSSAAKAAWVKTFGVAFPLIFEGLE